MNIYPSSKVNPYVYICIHRETKEFYIGSRVANKEPSHLDFPKYRTSSKNVKPRFDQFDWYIVAEFTYQTSKNDAYDFEQLLIYENWKDPLILNKHYSHGKSRFKCDTATGGKKWTPERIGNSESRIRVCSYCGVRQAANMINRHHNEKCKFKNIIT